MLIPDLIHCVLNIIPLDVFTETLLDAIPWTLIEPPNISNRRR